MKTRKSAALASCTLAEALVHVGLTTEGANFPGE